MVDSKIEKKILSPNCLKALDIKEVKAFMGIVRPRFCLLLLDMKAAVVLFKCIGKKFFHQFCPLSRSCGGSG